MFPENPSIHHAGKFHGDGHVAFDFQLAHHESGSGIQVTGQHAFEIFESHDDERTTESLAEEVIENLTADELIEVKAEDYADDALFEAKVKKVISEEEYEVFFKKALKKFGVSSPAELKTAEKKKEFFNYIDDNFKAKNEDRHPGRTDAGSDLPKIVGSYPLGNKDGRQYILDPYTFKPVAPYTGAPAKRTRRRGGELA